MTSFVIQVIKYLKKSIFNIYFYTFFLLKYIMGDKLHHFMKKIKDFYIILWYDN